MLHARCYGSFYGEPTLKKNDISVPHKNLNLSKLNGFLHDIYKVYCLSNKITNILFLLITGKSIWQLVLEQFDDLLVKILLLAAIISFVSSLEL